MLKRKLCMSTNERSIQIKMCPCKVMEYKERTVTGYERELGLRCSHCKEELPEDYDDTDNSPTFRFCYNCGVKMNEGGHAVNKVYIYKSHLGDLYVETEDIPWDDLYCETCGDSDELLFSTDNLEDVAKYFRDEGGLYLVSDIQSVYNICETLLKEIIND